MNICDNHEIIKYNIIKYCIMENQNHNSINPFAYITQHQYNSNNKDDIYDLDHVCKADDAHELCLDNTSHENDVVPDECFKMSYNYPNTKLYVSTNDTQNLTLIKIICEHIERMQIIKNAHIEKMHTSKKWKNQENHE